MSRVTSLRLNYCMNIIREWGRVKKRLCVLFFCLRENRALCFFSDTMHTYKHTYIISLLASERLALSVLRVTAVPLRSLVDNEHCGRRLHALAQTGGHADSTYVPHVFTSAFFTGSSNKAVRSEMGMCFDVRAKKCSLSGCCCVDFCRVIGCLIHPYGVRLIIIIDVNFIPHGDGFVTQA